MEGFVTVYYRGTVRKQDCWFENMEQELEMFDEAPSFNDLVLQLKGKFRGDWTCTGGLMLGKIGRGKY